MSKPPKKEDLRNLYTLSSEFASLQHTIKLARTVAQSGAAFTSTNPVIQFTFQRSEQHVVELTLLRMAEAIEIMDRVLVAYGEQSLFKKAGRDRCPRSPVFEYVYRLRHSWIAHRVSMPGGVATWNEMQDLFGSVWELIDLLMTSMSSYLAKVEAKGGFDEFRGKSVTIRQHLDFSDSDVAALVASARKGQT